MYSTLMSCYGNIFGRTASDSGWTLGRDATLVSLLRRCSKFFINEAQTAAAAARSRKNNKM